LAGVHVSPTVQALQLPARHTALVPHDVPFAAFTPVSLHAATPAVHDTEPTWHGCALGTQLAPAVQGAHAPLLQ